MTGKPVRPGFAFPRLHTLMGRAIAATGLDLSGLKILTEAASGAYASTAVLAAMAGAAHVYALAKSSRYGSAADVELEVQELASLAGVASSVAVVRSVESVALGDVDIVTNSGHLRPLDAELLEQLPDRAVLALMFEAWELRPSDLDLACCARRNIPIVGVNERHPAVDVFSFLGPLCVKLLHDCGVAVYSSRLALLSDNDFAPWIQKGLAAMGAEVEVFADCDEVYANAWDAVVIALRPGDGFSVDEAGVRHLAALLPSGACIVQFWGDVDRTATAANGLNVWPAAPPPPGHMGILLSAIGAEPVVRLQAGGLRAAELVYRGDGAAPGGIAQMVDNPRRRDGRQPHRPDDAPESAKPPPLHQGR